jgi:hypothetical protein
METRDQFASTTIRYKKVKETMEQKRTISNAPKQLDMNTFKVFAESHDGLAKSCRFVALIRPVGALVAIYQDQAKDLMYLTEMAELPGRGFMSMDVRYYGPNQKFPYLSQYEDINLTFLCRNRSIERHFFDNWQNIINPNNTFDYNYKDEYRAIIELYQYNDFDRDDPRLTNDEYEIDRPNPTEEYRPGPTAEYMFSLHDAYPILVNPQPVSWADDQFMRLGVTFTYSWWTRNHIEPGPVGNDGSGSFRLVDSDRVQRLDPTMSARSRLDYGS